MLITPDKTTPNKMVCEALRPSVKAENEIANKEVTTSHSNSCGCGHTHKSLLSLETLSLVVEGENSQSQTSENAESIHGTESNHHHETEGEEHVHGPSCNHHEIISKTKKPKSLFPLEEAIKGLNTNKTTKQLLTMISNLTPAMAVSEVSGVFQLNPLISSPLAITAMHLTNRGTNNEHLPKLLLTALSSLGVISAQQFANLPRILIRPLMAFAVFFIEKSGKHIHNEDCKHEKNHESHKKKIDFNVSKSDWINLLKLQGQINTVPWLVNLFTKTLNTLNKENNGINKLLGKIGISASHIATLSFGFIGLGALIDKSLTHFKVVSDKESIAMKAEGAVCACCGAPVCVAEAASEASAMSLVA